MICYEDRVQRADRARFTKGIKLRRIAIDGSVNAYAIITCNKFKAHNISITAN